MSPRELDLAEWLPSASQGQGHKELELEGLSGRMLPKHLISQTRH